MQIINRDQTHKVEAGMFMPSLPKLSDRCHYLLAEVHKDRKQFGSAISKSINPNMSIFPKEFFDELKILGVATPFDKVEVSLNLGSFLYDIYISSVTPPAAPLAKKIFEKELLDLATALQMERVLLNDKFLQGIREVMLDDQKWEKVKIHVSIKVGDSKIVVPTNASCADMFPGIIGDAVQIFMEAEREKNATPTTN